MQWGLDFIREFHLPSSTHHRWILIATYYFTKWIEADLRRKTIDIVIIQVLESNICSRFGCRVKIITDNAEALKSNIMEKL
jgi:hypothetical protein